MKIILFTIIILFILYLSPLQYKTHDKKEDFNIYCNEKNDEKYDFFQKKQ